MRNYQVLFMSAALLWSFSDPSNFGMAVEIKSPAPKLVSLAPMPDNHINPVDDKVISPKNTESFTAPVLEIAEMTGTLPLMRQLKSAQEAAKTNSGTNSALGQIIIKQRIIYLHTQIDQYLQTVNLELSSVIGRLNSAMAQLADSKALISDQRARMLRRNTVINLVSGGLTKIGGYTSALTPASPIPTNVLEVFDGGVQVLLSASTIRQQRSESKFFGDKPAILTAFIRANNNPASEYPESVWTYINRPSFGQGKTKSRREVLIDSWTRSGRLITAGAKGRQRNNASIPSSREKIIMDDIDDAVAMMSDIKSTVSGMESSLMELSQTINSSYKDDPPY